MNPSAQAIADGIRWEGQSLTVYPDSRRLPTQGIGRHHGVHVGDPPITTDTQALWFAQDWQAAEDDALMLFPDLLVLDAVRYEALVWLVFNMGEQTLSEFVPFIAHVHAREWSEAAFHLVTNMHMHFTPYVTEVGARAAETALRIATGTLLKESAV